MPLLDPRKTDQRPPEGGPLRYLGHDKHTEKLVTGKFGSNVAPKNAGKGAEERYDWICVECNHHNKEYHKTCFKCNQYTRPF